MVVMSFAEYQSFVPAPRLDSLTLLHGAATREQYFAATLVAKGGSPMQTEELLTELRMSQTDLARFVEAVVRDSMPYVVVPVEAVRAWQRREPQAWAKVSGWLADHQVAVVAV
jgi:hypothetical protein